MHQASHFKAKMHPIRFVGSVKLSLGWSLTYFSPIVLPMSENKDDFNDVYLIASQLKSQAQ